MLATTMLMGCQSIPIQSLAKSRFLTSIEMDEISAGSAAAASNVEAFAAGLAPQTTGSTVTLAASGGPLNYAFSQAMASASKAQLTLARGSIDIGIDGDGGGTRIDATSSATAAGRMSDAQINMQFYGLRIGYGVDLAFGTAVASACCGVTVSDISGQAQSRVDIAVVSSALPILDAGQVSALAAPSMLQRVGQ